MAPLLAFAHRLICAGLAGAQLFFAAVAAQEAFPRAVAQLPREDPRRRAAADLVGAMLARLDAATLAGCAVAVVCAMMLRARRAAAVLPLVAALCALGSSAWITPSIRALRDVGETGSAHFGLLHAASTGLLVIEFLLLCAATWHAPR